MSDSAQQMLVAASVDFLRSYPPFDHMQAEALQFLGEHMQLAYYPKDAQIMSAASGVARCLHIIQRGKVLARQAGDVSLVEFSSLTLGPGECFPIGAVMAQRPSTNAYSAIDDVFCYELPTEDFFALLQMSSPFHLFCTQYIASLLSQSRQQLQTQFSQRVTEQQTMNSPLAAIIKREAVAVDRVATIGSVVERMAAGHIGSMIVVDDEQRPVGIFTQSDVLKRVVLPAVPLDQPIASVMSASPHTLPLAATAYDAALAMATHGVRHVLAVDEGGRLRGVVSERDLFALQRVGLRQIRQTIDSATTMDTLLQASRDVRQLSLNLLAQGVGAGQITQFVSALNDTLTRRILELNRERHELGGIDWAWLSFGSEGRDEQTFSTDQDNGIVFAAGDEVGREEARERLLAFARAVNDDLDRCGFPLCVGKIMASNPALCLTQGEWNEKFTDWISTPEPEALLKATIFFDFRPLFGRFDLADGMRSALLEQTRRNPLFLRMLADNALSVVPALGKIRDFVTDIDPEHPGTIDLKKSGARVFIDAARIFALAHGIAATNTIARLTAAGTLMNVSPEEVAASVEAFNFIQLLRLRHQYLEHSQGRLGNNRIRPDDLNEVERRFLKEAFRQARKLQQRLKLDYQV